MKPWWLPIPISVLLLGASLLVGWAVDSLELLKVDATMVRMIVGFCLINGLLQAGRSYRRREGLS